MQKKINLFIKTASEAIRENFLTLYFKAANEASRKKKLPSLLRQRAKRAAKIF